MTILLILFKFKAIGKVTALSASPSIYRYFVRVESEFLVDVDIYLSH